MPKSFIPVYLFIADAERSPIWASIEPTTPLATQTTIVFISFIAKRESMKLPYIKANKVAVSIPPIEPSIVFLGLNVGISLCFPMAIPVKYAPVSQPQAHIKLR